MDVSGALMTPPPSGELLQLTTAEGDKATFRQGLDVASLLILRDWQHIQVNMEITNQIQWITDRYKEKENMNLEGRCDKVDWGDWEKMEKGGCGWI